MIHLIEDYYLDSDDRNFILFLKKGERTDKNGKELYVGEYFYYSDLQQLLTGLYKRLQRSQIKWSNSLEELRDRLAMVEATIEEIGSRVTR